MPLALELIEQQSQGPKVLGTDPDTQLPVYVLTGRFGPYVQLGDQEAGSKKKPKRSSLFASQTPETVTFEEALQLLALPRVVGTDTEGREIVASPGRFGPYLKRDDGDTRSLSSEEQLLTVTLAEAEALYAQPKPRRGRQQKPPIAELGAHPDSGAPVRVLEGRYGPYVTDGSVNATVPRGTVPAELSLDEAVESLARPRGSRAEQGEAAGEEGREEGGQEDHEEGGQESVEEAGQEGREEGGDVGAGYDVEAMQASA